MEIIYFLKYIVVQVNQNALYKSTSLDLFQNKSLQSTRKPTCQISNIQQTPKDPPIGYGVNLECAVFEIDPGMEYFTAL